MALTTEQVLLLNNLMYMYGAGDPLASADQYTGQTIGSWIKNIPAESLQANKDYGSFMTGKDWNDIIQAVKNDETLMNMTVKTTHTDWESGGGGGFSAVFVSEDTGDAVVAFKGTEGAEEWKDNFTGGNVTDTAQQKNALDWYQDVYKECGLDSYEVTVTGHSKGGNKSKYITLLDETVDHCVSFDGQGFSDKFMAEYKDQIAARQGVIENHNVDYDYVNLLLNDVGETTYYKGQDLGDGGFLENHCPNTFMKFGENGSFQITVNPDGQGREMQALDSFLNGYLRSMPDSQRDSALKLVNALVNNGFGAMSLDENASAQDYIDLFKGTITDPKYKDDIARLLAYAIKYEQTNPQMAEDIKSVLSQFGLGGAVKYVEIAQKLLNFEIDEKFGPFRLHLTFDDIFGFLTGAAGAVDWVMEQLSKIPFADIDKDWILKKLRDFLREQCGIDLTPDELRALLGIVKQVSDNLDDVKINKNGADIRVEPLTPSVSGPSGSGTGEGGGGTGNHRIRVNIQEIRASAKLLDAAGTFLSGIEQEVQSLNANLRFKVAAMNRIRERLKETEEALRLLSTRAKKLSEGLSETASLYEKTENLNTESLNPEHI